MTSRRSRLKAVTNLPVRRKTFTSQGNGNEVVAVDNLTSGKAYSSISQGEETISSTHVNETDINSTQNKNSKIENSVIVTCAVDFQNNDNCLQEFFINKIGEFKRSEVLESTSDISKSCGTHDGKQESGNGSTLRSSKRFKPNIVSSVNEEVYVQSPEGKIGNENIEELNCIAISNNNFRNNNNNIVEDGFKCYTVLTSQNVTLTPISEYTITPLTPCSNTYIGATLNEVDPSQEYEEVQIYTEVGPTELSTCNEVHENCESIIESQPFEPVLTNLTNCNNEQEVKTINYECLSTDFIELKNSSVNLGTKQGNKSKALNIKNNFNGSIEYYGNSLVQIKDSQVIENTVPSNSQNVSSDLFSHKQSISMVRKRRTKCSDFTKKLADAKREFQKKYEKTKPDRSTLKMIDLIFYNPATNPMESKSKSEKKDASVPSSCVTNDLIEEEKVDEPESADCNAKSNLSECYDLDNTNNMPVPQVKIGVDGEIILDEKSLIIETTEAKKGREGLQNSVPIFEDKEYKVSYYRGKSKKTKDWADFETKRFYKALNTIGPDFTLMQKYFPKRSRLELKNKFKREERLNRNLIDKALNNPSEFDMTELEKDLAIEKETEEVELEMRLCRIMKRAARKQKVKTSYLSREIIESDDSDGSQLESFDRTSKVLSETEKNKKEKEFDFVFQKLLMKESKRSVSVLPEISSSSSGNFRLAENGVT